MRQSQKRIKAKIIRHSPIFGKGYLETHCKCGCIYRTSMSGIKPTPRGFGASEEYREEYVTECPECKVINRTEYDEAIKGSDKNEDSLHDQ